MEASRVQSSPSGLGPYLHVFKGMEPVRHLFAISFWLPKVTVTGTKTTVKLLLGNSYCLHF